MPCAPTALPPRWRNVTSKAFWRQKKTGLARFFYLCDLLAAGDAQALEQVEGLAQLEVVILRSWRLAGGFAFTVGRFVRAAVAVAQVAGEVGFLEVLVVLFAGDLGAADFDVRHDALGLDGTAVGGEVQRGGDLQGAVVVQRQYGLHRAFAEAVGAHQYAALVVLQGAGDDFRGRGAAAVDQYHQWHAFAGIGRVGGEAQFGVGDAALGVDDQALLQEVIGDLHGRLQHAAGIVAQVEDDAA